MNSRHFITEDSVATALGANGRKVSAIHVFEEVGSTNDLLLSKAKEHTQGFMICLANSQTSGRGRWGRQWASPPDCNLYMSLATRLNISPADIGGLQQRLAIAAARLIRQLGGMIHVKWPNDLLHDGKKLGGILVESKKTMDGWFYVAGIGMNVAMQSSASLRIDQSWTTLEEVLDGVPTRGELAGVIASAWIDTIAAAVSGKRSSLSTDWEDVGYGKGKKICLSDRDGNTLKIGMMSGVDESGCIILSTITGKEIFSRSDATLRFLE